MSRVLVMGLSGSGKTTLSTLLVSRLGYQYLNADSIRSLYEDWDFSLEGRVRQAERMRILSQSAKGKYICDFICPTEETRKVFAADFTIWMDTTKSCQYLDTSLLFQPPLEYDIRIESFDYSIEEIVKNIRG